MELLEDISQKLKELFPREDLEEARNLVINARLHDGVRAAPRSQRCAVFASDGSLEKLKYYIDLLKIDFRDVIVAGEYEDRDGDLVLVRDLSKPF